MSKQLQASFNQEELDRIERACKQEFIRVSGLIYTAVMKHLEKIERKESS